VAERVEYWLTGSALEELLLHFELARRHSPEHYRALVKLRPPAFLKVIRSNAFPRTQITRRLSGGRSLYYGPFRTRTAAEQFQSQFLDLFQVRRCEEDLVPNPHHPGCIYGEMGMCLRPCQQVVGVDEYRSEVGRLVEFLHTDGRSLLGTMTAARDRLSQELNFEDAARQHKRLEKVQQVLKLRDELVRETGRVNGVAVTASVASGAVNLWFFLAGAWQDARNFVVEAVDGASVSLDQRLREIVASLSPAPLTTVEREDHMALLARWYYSSWRQGEWLPFDTLEAVPYRRLVRAISRVAAS
jgi:excinuclease UvrABC nuclease subunit